MFETENLGSNSPHWSIDGMLSVAGTSIPCRSRSIERFYKAVIDLGFANVRLLRRGEHSGRGLIPIQERHGALVKYFELFGPGARLVVCLIVFILSKIATMKYKRRLFFIASDGMLSNRNAQS